MKCFKFNKLSLFIVCGLFFIFLLLLLSPKKEHLESTQNNNPFTSIIANIEKDIQDNSKIISDTFTNNNSKTITGNILLDTRLNDTSFKSSINDIISGNISASNNISNISPNLVVDGTYVDNIKNNLYGSTCKDDDTVATNCPYWAMAGDCVTKESYMFDKCKKSCNKC
jgi:hypothetical protein